MMQLAIPMMIALAALPLAGLGAASAAGFDHSAWDRVLKEYVNEAGEVDYARLKAARKEFDGYIGQLAESSPTSQPSLFPLRNHHVAYWLNAYNALAIKGVLDAYPVESVTKLGLLWGFFRKKQFTVGGVAMSLDNIEHDTLRKRYPDPRLHFALVCASISCPRLAREAFSPDRLEIQLDGLTRAFLNERRAVLIEPERNRVTLSSILKWYRDDFERPPQSKAKQSLLDFLRPWLGAAARARLDTMKKPSIDFHSYDWNLNDSGSRRKAKSPLEREAATPQSP